MSRELTPKGARQLRRGILEVLRARHNVQAPRFDDVGLTHALQSLAFEVSVTDIVTMLQDLKDRGYVRFVQKRDDFRLRTYLDKIEITAAGRDQVEENRPLDPALED